MIASEEMEEVDSETYLLPVDTLGHDSTAGTLVACGRSMGGLGGSRFRPMGQSGSRGMVPEGMGFGIKLQRAP